MKNIIITFFVLLVVFFTSWGVKVRMPIDRPVNLDSGSIIPWYMSSYSSPTVGDEWQLDPTIPDNYVPVPGEDNMFMIVDSSGKIIGYKQRHLGDDNTWIWEDVNPDIPDNYELVAGSKDLYKVTDSDGNVSYYLYVRNDDDTYAFVPCDEFGVPYYDGEDADVIASNFVHEDGNIYSVYNEDGIKIGNAERVDNGNGSFTWKNNNGNTLKANKTTEKNTEATTQATTETTTEKTEISTESKTIDIPSDQQKGENDDTVVNDDGTYTVTSVTTNTVTEDGYNVLYKTTIYNTYDKDGNLLFTKQEGPEEVQRTPVAASQDPDLSLIQTTLDGEYNRVSALVGYNTELANQVLSLLNAERTNQGLATLSMDTNSESYKLACIRAGDMATYNYAASESPMYGTLNDMVSLWGCSTASASENVWKAGNKSADDIHARFQAYDGSRNIRMSESYTEVGIAIVSKDGQLYIAEIYLK